MRDFFSQDVAQRARLARMAKYRVGGSKSKKCPMSTDGMTQKQWEKRNGKVSTFKLHEPMTFDSFKQLPCDIQKEYLKGLVENFNVNTSSLSEMFGVTAGTVRNHIEKNDLGIKFKVGHSMTAEQKEKWNQFLNMNIHNEGQAICQEQKENDERAMDMTQFSFVFQGNIDAITIANSIRKLAGAGAIGKVEVVCTMLPCE